MEICFRVLGEIKIDNNIHSLDIYSPCKKICKTEGAELVRKQKQEVQQTTYMPLSPKA
jgi:hypothetical protein